MSSSDSQQLATGEGNPIVSAEPQPRCLQLAQSGIKTSANFSGFMSALMSDLIDGRINANIGNATVNAGGKLLKMLELRLKYGSKADAIAP